MSANWAHHRFEHQQVMTDFAGQKLVVGVVGDSSATGRDTAADLPDRMQMERVRQQLANEPSGRKGCRGAVPVGEHRKVAPAAPQRGPDGTTATGLSRRPAPSACSQRPPAAVERQSEVQS
jgi:hypothetical protein